MLTPFGQIGTVTGVYDIPAAYVTIDAVLSNTSPTAPYRGAGRPEAIYLIERIIEAAAQELGIDPIELRRRNIIPATKLPYKAPLGPYYDCGEFEKNMDLALEAADYAGFAARQDASQANGMLRGIAVANAIEQAAGPTPEYAEIRFNPSGTAIMLLGTKTHGQGHETSFKQILHERLGIAPDDVQFIDGDTDRVAFGMGSNGSRSMVSGGTRAHAGRRQGHRQGQAARRPHAGSRRSRHRVRRRQVHRRRHRSRRHPEAGGHGRVPAGAAAARHGSRACTKTPPTTPKRDTFPNGCHVAEVEVDPETGVVDLLSYLVVDDVGTVINPLTLAGQIHGGVAQGVGQILSEQVVYDREIRPAADRQLHGLHHAARRHDVPHQDRQQSGSDCNQSAGRQGRGRGRLRRRTARGHDRRHERARPGGRQGTRHAGDQRTRLAGHPGARDTSQRRRIRCAQDRNTARRCATAAGLHPGRGPGRRRNDPSRDQPMVDEYVRLVRPPLRSRPGRICADARPTKRRRSATWCRAAPTTWPAWAAASPRPAS